MARIQFENVTKRYGGSVLAVDKLSLEIKDKEFMVLLGPSGCGKSTTLNIIAGLEEVSEGNLYFDRTLVNHIPPHKRDVAMVFQSYALYPHKSVFDNIAFGLRMRGYPKTEVQHRVQDAARRLEIEHLLERRPHQLSGGQRQRVALGRAMVRQPAVFLMDEPLSNLDAALRISMRAEIKELHRTMETTFVYVTHDQAEALTLADRVAVMRDGVVQQVGTPEEIYEQPLNMYVASFLGNPTINFLDGRLEPNGEDVTFHGDEIRLVLPPELDRRLVDRDGREVTIGIRPEDIDERAEPREGVTVHGQLSSVLPVGSDQYLGMRVAGRELFFRVGKDVRHRYGETVSLVVDINRLHVFDRETQETLLASRAGKGR